MKAATSTLVVALLTASIAAGLLLADRDTEPDRNAATTAPYHLTGVEPAVADSGDRPLPAPQDPESADRMAAAGTAMVAAAQGMESAVAALIALGNPALAELGQHWLADARALRARGSWMVTSSTSDSMVHDPDRAREINLENLRANGLTMAEEGRALADHGREMATQIEQLRQGGTISAVIADDLAARAKAMVTAGAALERDGERMQEDAESLLRSLGR